MIAANVGFAPDHANSGWLSGENTATSVLRAERIGPTGSESCDWKIAASRVTAPSTFSSYTTSAWLRPVCGRAWLLRPSPSALSIFTTSAGRANLPGSVTGNPVRGMTGGGAVVVVATVVVGADVVVGAAFFFPPPQATSKRQSATNTIVRWRMVNSQLP